MKVRPIRKVVEQHAEAASFLWLRRDAAVKAPHYGLGNLVGLDDRVEAHLAGLRISGDTGWEVVQEMLAWRESGELFAATQIALSREDPTALEGVLAIARDASKSDPEVARGSISAIGWAAWAEVAELVARLMNSEDPWLRRVGVAGAAIHRRLTGDELMRLLDDRDPGVRARASRACGEMNLGSLLRYLPLGDPDEDVTFWSAWAGAMLGDSRCLQGLMGFCRPDWSRATETVELLGRRLPLEEAIEFRGKLASSPGTLRLAIQAAGAIGSPGLVDWLLLQMEEPAVSRVAGEAFATITGADLSFEDLDGPHPPGYVAGPSEDPSDENVAIDVDENLPWPDPERLRSWWMERRSRLETGGRLLCGNAIDLKSAAEVMRTRRQRQRRAAALELVRLSGSKPPLIETRARACRQQAGLEQ